MSEQEARGIVKAAEAARRRSGATWKVLVPTAAALGVGAAVAMGAIPGSGGTITGCYQDVTNGTVPYGTLRVIDPSQTNAGDPAVYSCNADEQTVTWNQQGQPGTPATIMGAQGMDTKATRCDPIFTKLDGVPGDVHTKGMQGQITTKSWSWGTEGVVANASPSGDVAASADPSNATVRTFDLVKQVDASDGALVRDMTDNTKIREAVVTEYHGCPGHQLTQVASFDFRPVYVTNMQQSGPSESVSLSFGEMKTTYGTTTNKVSTGWTTPGFNLTQMSAK